MSGDIKCQMRFILLWKSIVKFRLNQIHLIVLKILPFFVLIFNDSASLWKFGVSPFIFFYGCELDPERVYCDVITSLALRRLRGTALNHAHWHPRLLPCFCRCSLGCFRVSSFVKNRTLPSLNRAERVFYDWPQISGLASGILLWQSADRSQDMQKLWVLLSDNKKYIHTGRDGHKPTKVKDFDFCQWKVSSIKMRKQTCRLFCLILTLFVFLYRLQNLKNTFETKYGESPLFYAYAPGRVNLIGNYIS